MMERPTNGGYWAAITSYSGRCLNVARFVSGAGETFCAGDDVKEFND